MVALGKFVGRFGVDTPVRERPQSKADVGYRPKAADHVQ
jgi:hypothetical protein